MRVWRIPKLSERHWHVTLAAALCVLLSGSAAFGFVDSSKYSDTEKVLFAFSKLSNVPPDYESLINSSDYYKRQSPITRLDLMKSETARLQEGFNNYNPEDDLVHIVADVEITWNKKDFPGNWNNLVSQPQFGASDSAAVESKIYHIAFGAAAGGDKTSPFFPFFLGRLWIAVVPKDIGAFLNLSLNMTDFYQFMRKLGIKPGFGHSPAIIEMMLRPVSANATEPVEIDGVVYWPMLVEIANLTIWTSNRDHIIWSYDAPWYETKDQKDMRDLYDKDQ